MARKQVVVIKKLEDLELEEKLKVKKLHSKRGRSTHKESDKKYFIVLDYCYYS